jgi:hypothetical protein
LIVKELTVPLKLQSVQCLEKRMLSTHRQYPQILSDVAKRKAGYYGERSLCYYFQQLPPTSYLFHNLRLEQHESAFCGTLKGKKYDFPKKMKLLPMKK